MSVGQLIVLVAITAFFGYEAYALVRDLIKKHKVKKEFMENQNNEKN